MKLEESIKQMRREKNIFEKYLIEGIFEIQKKLKKELEREPEIEEIIAYKGWDDISEDVKDMFDKINLISDNN